MVWHSLVKVNSHTFITVSKFERLVGDICMDGNVSHVFNLGPRFHFMIKNRNIFVQF